MLKILIVSPKSSLEAINNVIEKNQFECFFYFKTYNNVEDIKDIINQYEGKIDGVFFSGDRGYVYAQQNIKNLTIPYKYIAYDTVDILSLLLNFVLDHPDIPLNRVYVDFLSDNNNYNGILDFIKEEHLPVFNHTGINREASLEVAKDLWQNNKIDIMLTRFSSNIENISKTGIPYIHIIPTEKIIKKSIEKTLLEIKMNKLEKSPKLVCLIKPSYELANNLDEREYILITLHKALIDIKKQLNKNINISNTTGRFELIFYDYEHEHEDEDESLRMQSIRYFITSLIKNENINFNLGAGISSNYDNSRFLAEKALKESLYFGLNDGFIAYDNDVILGPLSREDSLIYSVDSSYINKFSKDNNIDIGNMQRIIGIYNKNKNEELNSQILSRWLNITPRSCNRIIKQLLKHQLIVEIENANFKTKGRPIKKYKFVKENIDKILAQ